MWAEEELSLLLPPKSLKLKVIYFTLLYRYVRYILVVSIPGFRDFGIPAFFHRDSIPGFRIGIPILKQQK
jgi:hypothetical protein